MDPAPDAIELTEPSPSDGPRLARLADEVGGLDVKPIYAYALWGREFADTSVVARLDGEPVGFLTGFRRPAEPGTLFVWQLAVHPAQRGRRLALRMVQHAVGRSPAVTAVEATVAPSNAASMTTFERFAADTGAPLTTEPLFDERHVGEGHEPEHLVRIAPLSHQAAD